MDIGSGAAPSRVAKSQCDVSVVIPVYNRASLLRWPLTSIAAQTRRPREVIVVDDCSSPEDAEIVRSIVREFARSVNIRLLVNDRNRGNSYSRNRAINEACSKFVAILDSDDFWLPEKLERQIESIERAKARNTTPVFSATGTYWVNTSGDIMQRKLCKTVFDAGSIQKSNFIPTSSIIIETCVAREIGGFAEDMRNGSDWDFNLRLIDRVQFVALPDPLSVYVEHQVERLSKSTGKTLRAMLLIRRRHMRHATRENFTFYRKFAKALQEHGKTRAARKFYIRSIALKQRDGWRRRLAESWLGLYYSVAEMPQLTDKWQSYHHNPIEREHDAKVRAQWNCDQEQIHALMHTKPEAATAPALAALQPAFA